MNESKSEPSPSGCSASEAASAVGAGFAAGEASATRVRSVTGYVTVSKNVSALSFEVIKSTSSLIT